MTRYSDEFIERTKRAADLPALARARGAKLIRSGNSYKCLCFFHEETEASLFFYNHNGIEMYKCHGCGRTGDGIKFIMEVDGLKFRPAVKQLAHESGVSLPNMEKSEKQTTTVLGSDPVVKQKHLNRIAEHYHQTFLQEKDGVEYLKKRGIYSPELVKEAKIGYSNRTLNNLVPRGSEHRKVLQEIGIFNARTGHELFAGSIVLPILDENGNVTEMYARKTGDKLRKGTAQHLFLPGPHKGVWNARAFKSFDSIILCEAPIDAMTFWINGFKNVTFCYGTGGFTDDHLELLIQNRIVTVYCAFDNDDAGNRAAKKLAERLADYGITTYRLDFPKGMDANDYALKVTPADKSLALLFKAPPLIGGTPAKAAADTATDDVPEAAKGKIGPVDVVSPATKDVTLPADHELEAAGNKIMPDVAIPDDHRENDTGFPHIGVERKHSGIFFTIGDRKYRVRGLVKNKSYEVMKVSIRAAVNGCYHLDTVDLVQDRQRRIFIKNAADELSINTEIVKHDLGKILLLLEDIHEEVLEKTKEHVEEEHRMTDGEKKAALEYLQSPDLMDWILRDFHTCGIVNEDTNLLIGYLATLTRHFNDPMAVMFQSAPGSGKSTVMDAVLDFVPEEDKRVITYITGQSLFYTGENDLRHKILAIEEDEGAEDAIYSLKTMQSEKKITIQSTGTDPQTGRNKSFIAEVNGPMALFICTTKPFVQEEFMLRFCCLGADESRLQTTAVQKRQSHNETFKGLIDREKARQIQHLHRNIQRLLRPIAVINPYADRLTFPSNNLRTRRDYMRYLALIRSFAFLYQYQRDHKVRTINGVETEYIEVIPSDIRLAYSYYCEIMGRTLDELSPQSRNLLNMLVDMVREACEKLVIDRKDFRFGQKEIRDFTGWSAYQVKVHMKRLVDLEYVYCHRSRRGRLYEYELVYDGEGDHGKKFVLGISDIENLDRPATSTTKVAENKAKVGVG